MDNYALHSCMKQSHSQCFPSLHLLRVQYLFQAKLKAKAMMDLTAGQSAYNGGLIAVFSCMFQGSDGA